MIIENGVVVTRDVDTILDEMVADAEEFFDTNFSNSQYTTVRTFYEPIAIQKAQMEQASAEILRATQIDNASGEALDLLCALIGVQRQEATPAIGTVTFSRETPSDVRDYTIPSGTMVRTDGNNPIIFETTEAATLEMGTSHVDVSIEAIESGSNSNVASNVITVIRDDVTGIESVINNDPTYSGTDKESDEELRERAKGNLSEGSSATPNSLVESVSDVPDVNSVTIFPNDGSLGDMPGWELVVHGGDNQAVADMIGQKMAGGDVPYSGNYGQSVEETVTLSNGQDWPVEFSRPEKISIYVDVTVTTEDTFEGVEPLKDSIVEYIGGTTTSGTINDGEISVGDDVLFGEVEYYVRDVEGVYDVTSLTTGTTEPPNDETNIVIEDYQVAEVDVSNITVTVN